MQVKAGEFYTPQQVSKILAKIVTTNKPNLKMFMTQHVVQVHYCYVSDEADVRFYYGQEYNNTTFNLARMNMLLHDVNYTRFKIDNDDTLENPAFRGEKFDAVVANPPYSAKWSADPSF